MAPALGVFIVDDPAPTQALFLAWTTPNLNIDFARWESAAAQWVDSASPVALPAGPLTSYTPALNSSTSSCPSANDAAAVPGATAVPGADVELAAKEFISRNVVAFSNTKNQVVSDRASQSGHGCP